MENYKEKLNEIKNSFNYENTKIKEAYLHFIEELKQFPTLVDNLSFFHSENESKILYNNIPIYLNFENIHYSVKNTSEIISKNERKSINFFFKINIFIIYVRIIS